MGEGKAVAGHRVGIVKGLFLSRDILDFMTGSDLLKSALLESLDSFNYFNYIKTFENFTNL